MRMLTRPSQHGELVVYAAWWSKAASDICKRAGFRVGQVNNGFLPFCAVVDGHWLWKCTVSPLVHLVEGFHFVCVVGIEKVGPGVWVAWLVVWDVHVSFLSLAFLGRMGIWPKTQNLGVSVAGSCTFVAVTVLFMTRTIVRGQTPNMPQDVTSNKQRKGRYNVPRDPARQ